MKIEYRCSVGHKKGDDFIAVDRVLPRHMAPQGVRISFQRTIRVPDNEGVSLLPPDLGSFPLHRVHDHASRLPDDAVRRGGVFFPMHRREAMWVSFEATAPFMIKMYAGGVNVVSGERGEDDEDEDGDAAAAAQARRAALLAEGRSVQDYVVVPEQPWLDGIAVAPGTVRQFVAMPTGEGYTVEAQITGEEAVGGLQFDITPARCEPRKLFTPRRPRPPMPKPTGADNFHVLVRTLSGKTIQIMCDSWETVYEIKRRIEDKEGIPPDQQRLILEGKQLDNNKTLDDYETRQGASLHLVLRLRGGGKPEPVGHDLGIAPGGLISQYVHEDRRDPGAWLRDLTFSVPVRILDPAAFRRAAGAEPPPCPVDAAAYARAGLPFFALAPDEEAGSPSDVSGADAFAPVRSVRAVEAARGLAPPGGEAAVLPRAVALGGGGGGGLGLGLGAKVRAGGDVFHVDDPEGLLSPEGPRREVRTVTDLLQGLVARMAL